jgi:DNA-binding response OmpR family regulator
VSPTGIFPSGSSPDESHAPRSLRVLIADDERDTVLMLMAILRDEGHEVRGVHNGKDALAAFVEFDPDVAIIDIAMPGMTGWDVARTVRKLHDGTRPLLIACSGHYTKGSDQALAKMAGFTHCLPKPCDPDELLALLKPLATG